MHVDNLQKAISLQAELKLWLDARRRCDTGVFKSATLRVTDAAHGHMQQTAETVIQVPPDELSGFADAQIARLKAALVEIGVDL